VAKKNGTHFASRFHRTLAAGMTAAAATTMEAAALTPMKAAGSAPGH
jgi:hypothetical protein